MKVAMVTSYERPCGIAQYVEHLEPELRKVHRNLSILPLPIDDFRSRGAVARKGADRHFNEIVSSASAAEIVNVQFEPGLFGMYPLESWKRVKKLISASKRLVITLHTMPDDRRIPIGSMFNPQALVAGIAEWRLVWLYRMLFSLIRRSGKKCAFIVQTRRAQRTLLYEGFDESRVLDHPLAFVSPEKRQSITREKAREIIGRRFSLNSDDKWIGFFGFIAQYKGLNSLIEALAELPKEFKLLVVGNLHPLSLVKGRFDRPYLSKILQLIDEKTSKGRVFFCGTLANDDYQVAITACDYVVLPYFEVGQTSSGPASMALDLHANLFLSRTECFLELEKYARNCIEFFDIGNYVELAQSVARYNRSPEREAALKEYTDRYNLETRVRTYLKAFEKVLG